MDIRFKINRKFKNLFIVFHSIVEKISKRIITFNFRPLYTGGILLAPCILKNEKNCAIIMQGPIIAQNDFTLNTIKLYRNIFPDVKIIISIWSDESEKEIKKIQQLDCETIIINKLENPGPSNINLQILSSKVGINLAEKLGYSHVLKTRSDQRIYSIYALNLFQNILKNFPIKDNKYQKDRLIGLSLNTFKYRMYGLSDMMLFGNIEDVRSYWSAEYDQRLNFSIPINATLREYARHNICEVYLMSEYLKKIKRNPLWTLRDSWNAFADFFCVIDSNMIDIYWPKYQRYLENRNLKYYQNSHDEMNFSEWLNIYSNLDSINIPEQILELQRCEKIIDK